ncbi:MAG TPA: hypothetical protein VMI75_35165 [Polyangiaceae bacterium]|nr:hypothetical protein [Polyangiaceae bacterium]
MPDPRDEHEIPDPELARVLRAAWSPEDLSPEEHKKLVAKAIAPRRATVVRVSFGASAILALAASVLLAVWTDKAPRPGPNLGPVLSVSRSTQSLFARPFAPTGGESARVDRIAMARAADLRENQFAKWGVR